MWAMPTTPRTPECRRCGSTALTATSSQQYRYVKGYKRLLADVTCDGCGHSWWSVHPAIRAMARKADEARTA